MMIAVINASRRHAFAVTCLILIPFLGCSSSSEPKIEEPEATEIKSENFDASSAGQEELFENGRRYYQRALYSVARESFEQLSQRFPLGPYAEFGEIKAADAAFEGGEYAVAAPLYEEFVKNRPASAALPYALLQTARSYQLAQRGVGRDTAFLSKSVEYYQRLTKEFPRSAFTEGAELQLQRVKDELAAYDKAVLEFYRAQGKEAAYEARLKEFQDKWGKSHDEFVLPENEPELIEQPKLVERPVLATMKLARSESGSGNLTKAPASATTTGREIAQAYSTPLAPDQIGIKAIECESTSRLVFIHLTRAPEKGSIENRTITGSEGKLLLALPKVALPAESRAQACFAQDDLSLSSNGIALQTESQAARVLVLDNPPRVMLALR